MRRHLKLSVGGHKSVECEGSIQAAGVGQNPNNGFANCDFLQTPSYRRLVEDCRERRLAKKRKKAWAAAPNFAVDINNEPGAQSWPIVTTTFVLLPTNATDGSHTAAVLKFFDWAFSNGDGIAQGLQYIPLPDKVKAQVRAAWKSLK